MGKATKKRIPEANRTRSDSQLELKVQQNLLIDIVLNPQLTPLQIIRGRTDGLYGDADRPEDSKLCVAVKSKIFFYRKLKDEDAPAYWSVPLRMVFPLLLLVARIYLTPF